jgi:hypothetical protein
MRIVRAINWDVVAVAVIIIATLAGLALSSQMARVMVAMGWM